MTNFYKLLLSFPVLVMSCSSGLNVIAYKGNPVKQRVERKVVKNGKDMVEGLYTNDPRFAQMTCFMPDSMKRFQELYNRAKKAGVKVDDL